jgi:hypothetical protein
VYKDLLGREADDGGLNNYMKSGLTIDEIKDALLCSVEYLEKRRVKEFARVVDELGSDELMMLGSYPKTSENIEMLKKRGVKSVLCLDAKAASSYDHSWVENFLVVDIEVNKFFSKEKVELALKFLYDSIDVKKVPTYIHSDVGVERAPLIGALFLVAARNMRYNKALELIMEKSKYINPNKFYVKGAILEHVQNMRGALGGYESKQAEALNKIVKITDNIYMTSTISDEMVDALHRGGFKSILDLNKDKAILSGSQSYGWFNHMHLPVLGDQVKNLIPVVIKNITKLEKNGKVVVSSVDKGILFSVYGEMISGGAYIVEDHNSILKAIFSV